MAAYLADTERARAFGLSDRQVEALGLAAEGLSSKEQSRESWLA